MGGYNQVSFNVQGGYTHELFSWKPEHDPEVPAHQYRLNRRCGSTNPPVKFVRHARGTLTKDSIYAYTTGQAWALDYPQIHDILIGSEGCWTVNFRVKSLPEACTVYNRRYEDGSYDRPEWLPSFLDQNLQLAKETVGDTLEQFVNARAVSQTQQVPAREASVAT